MDADRAVEEVGNSFVRYCESDRAMRSLLRKLEKGTATYTDAGAYAVRVGNALTKSYKLLGAGTVDYDTALKLLMDPMNSGYSKVISYTTVVQNLLNNKYKIGIDSIKPTFRTNMIRDLAKLASADGSTFDSILGSVTTFTQMIVDDSVEQNAYVANNLGLKPMIVRTYEGPHRQHTNAKDGGEMCDCEWCLGLSGTWDYEDVKRSGNDIYKRHEGCRCSLEYIPVGGSQGKSRTSGNAFVAW